MFQNGQTEPEGAGALSRHASDMSTAQDCKMREHFGIQENTKCFHTAIILGVRRVVKFVCSKKGLNTEKSKKVRFFNNFFNNTPFCGPDIFYIPYFVLQIG